MEQVKLRQLVQERPRTFKDRMSMFRCEQCEEHYLRTMSVSRPVELPYFYYSHKKKSKNICPICGTTGLTRFSIGAVMERRWNGPVKQMLSKIDKPSLIS